jgi:hypothetical protein
MVSRRALTLHAGRKLHAVHLAHRLLDAAGNAQYEPHRLGDHQRKPLVGLAHRTGQALNITGKRNDRKAEKQLYGLFLFQLIKMKGGKEP